MAMLLNVPGVAAVAGGSTPLAFLLGGCGRRNGCMDDAVPELPRPLRVHGVELFWAEDWVFEAMTDSWRTQMG